MPNSYPHGATRQASWFQTVIHMVPLGKTRDALQLPHSASLMMPNNYPTLQASRCQTVTPVGKSRIKTVYSLPRPTWCHSASLVMLNTYLIWPASWCRTISPLGKPRDAKQLPSWASLVMPNSYPTRPTSWCQTVTSLDKPHDAKQLPTR